MSKKAKPKRPYNPKRWGRAHNTFEIAARGCALMNVEAAKEIAAPIGRILARWQEGSVRPGDFADLEAACEVSRRIEAQGIVRKLSQEIDSFKASIDLARAEAQHMGQSFRPGRACLDAIRDFIEVHTFQISNLSTREFKTVFVQAATTHMPAVLADLRRAEQEASKN